MKRIILLFMFLGLIVYVNAQNTTNPEWKTYLEGYEIEHIADAGNYLWLTNGSQVIKFDKNTGSAIFYSLDGIETSPDYGITSITCNENGLPWIGVYRIGVLKLNEDEQWTALPVPDSEFNYVGDILITDTDTVWTWMSTPVGSILVRYQENTVDTFTEDYVITSLAQDKDGNLWIGKMGGIVNGYYEPLVKFDGENWRTFNAPLELGHTPMWIGEIIFDDLGNLWMAGKFGVGIDSHEEKLLKFDGTVWEVYELPPVGGWINSVALQDNSIIWLVTTRGLMKFSTSQWTAYDTENSDLPTDDINSLVVDDDGTKWLGTENGVVAFNENGLLSTSDYSELMNDIVLCPNPAHDFITLKMPEGLQHSTVDIFNIQGKKLRTFSINTNRERLDVSAFPSGIYFVNIQANENHFTKKFIKQ